jgi:hypothetical protein
MALRERLQADLKDALRAHDEVRKNVIRMALTALVNAEMAHEGELSEAEEIAVLQKQAKQREETIEELRTVDRPEMLAQEKAELQVLERYLPELLSRQEIAHEARQVIDEVGASSMRDMGPVMGRLMAKLQGRADGHVVSEVVRELLSR